MVRQWTGGADAMKQRVFTTSLGAVAGRALPSGVIHVARLRYARAPEGPLRFALPEPLAPWSDVLTPAAAPVVPPQLHSRLAKVMGDYPATQSEDCLHLDIWVPEGAGGALPVLVFLHGGAFMTGGGSLTCYDGARLAAQRGIIVVNVSSRLGVLGYLPVPGIAPANLGLHDQIAALRWLRREIAGFGGDPGNITAAGQSAGAYAIAAIMAALPAGELFDRAVMMSLPLGIPLRRVEETEPMARSLLERLDIAPGDGAALSRVPLARLLEAQAALLRAARDPDAPDSTNPPFRPVIDGVLLSGDPAAVLARMERAPVPVLAGVTREEHAGFYLDAPEIAAIAPRVLEARFEAVYPGHGAAALRAARLLRPGAKDVDLLGEANSQLRFVRPTVALVERCAAVGGRAYLYMFDWQSPHPGIKATHCIELPFLLGNFATWRDAPMLAGARAAELEDLGDRFQGAIAGFARDGDPGKGLGLAWPDFGEGRNTMHFDRLLRLAPLVPPESYF